MKLSPLNMRTTPALRKKIEKAAAASGRSLVAEVEYRVEASFQHDYVADMLADILDAIHELDHKMKLRWREQNDTKIATPVALGELRHG